MMDAADPRFGDFRIVRLIGKGGMSEVYEVEHVRLGSRHALKLFTYERDDPEVRRRFETEGRLLARLNHPRIVRVTDIGVDAETGRPYFVMDLVRDERGQQRSLADVPPGTADEETVGRWYDDLREGLAYIHANGVIHRDLKLQNVLVGPDGHVVLADFGISKIFAAEGAAAVVDTVQTIVKVRDGRSLVMGSPGYMAPELEMGAAHASALLKASKPLVETFTEERREAFEAERRALLESGEQVVELSGVEGLPFKNIQVTVVGSSAALISKSKQPRIDFIVRDARMCSALCAMAWGAKDFSIWE